jgi:hypothetical protein
MTAQYHLTVQELNFELVQAIQKAFGGKKVTIEIRINSEEQVPEEDFAIWRKQVLADSARQLNSVYADDEPEYSKSDLIKTNPAFQS